MGLAQELAASGGDGWDFDDDDDEGLGDAPRAVAAAVEHGWSMASAGGGGAAAGGRGGGVTAVGLGSAENDGGSEARRLRARLMSLRYLLDTFLALEGEQGRGFDVGRLREFLGLGAEGSNGERRRCTSLRETLFLFVRPPLDFTTTTSKRGR